MSELLLRNVRPLGGTPADMLIRGEQIVAIDTNLAATAGARVIDGGGGLLLPGLVEGHAHLDKTLWGAAWYRNAVGPTRLDRIENERSWRATAGHDAAARSLALALAYLANGTTRLRTHVDIDTEIGLQHLHAVQQTETALAGALDMQIVAFPQSGLIGRSGTEALMDAALHEGADIVGGIDPCAIERDPVRALDVLFDLAVRHGKPLDIHLHEPGEMGAFSLDLILERTAALGLQGKVVISHGFCLGGIPELDRDALLARMASLGVAIATTAPAGTPVPPLAACRAAGVTIFGGNDGIRDTWTPYARPDMLDRAMHIGLRNALRRDDEIAWACECVTSSAARGCGFADYGLVAGCRADCVLVAAETIAEAVAATPARQLVVAGGRVVHPAGEAPTPP